MLAWIVECPVFYPVSGLAKVMGKLLDSVQKCQHLLAVVGSVAELFTRLKKGIHHVFAHLAKPGMQRIELVTEDEPKNHSSGFFLDSARQRSEQNLTWSQSRSHFLRHVKGRPQCAQSFWGRLDLATPRTGLKLLRMGFGLGVAQRDKRTTVVVGVESLG